jgi:hypothetical protein
VRINGFLRFSRGVLPIACTAIGWRSELLCRFRRLAAGIPSSDRFPVERKTGLFWPVFHPRFLIASGAFFWLGKLISTLMVIVLTLTTVLIVKKRP